MEGCVSLERAFVTNNIDLYYVAYYCFRVIFIHIVPCCALVVLNALLGINRTIIESRFCPGTQLTTSACWSLSSVREN